MKQKSESYQECALLVMPDKYVAKTEKSGDFQLREHVVFPKINVLLIYPLSSLVQIYEEWPGVSDLGMNVLLIKTSSKGTSHT